MFQSVPHFFCDSKISNMYLLLLKDKCNFNIFHVTESEINILLQKFPPLQVKV